MGTEPIIGKIFKGSAWFSVVSRFTSFRIVDITTYFTFIFFHFKSPFINPTTFNIYRFYDIYNLVVNQISELIIRSLKEKPKKNRIK